MSLRQVDDELTGVLDDAPGQTYEAETHSLEAGMPVFLTKHQVLHGRIQVASRLALIVHLDADVLEFSTVCP